MPATPHWFGFCLALQLWAAAGCWAQIVVTYHERPPYLSQGAAGEPAGLTGTPAANAFRQAGIPVKWMMVPTNRQLAMLRDAQQPSCAIGWFRNAEREQFARFTRPIYRDKAWALLAHAAYKAPADATLEQLLQNPATRVVVKDNFSYGAEIDALIARHKVTLAITTGSTEQMLQSVSSGAVDFMFVSEEEGEFMLSHHNSRAAALRLLRPRGMPRGAERHIMCGKAVPESVIERLNKAIALR